MASAPASPWHSEHEWLPIPEVAERIGLGLSRIRRLIEERTLAAVRVDGVLLVPALFLVGAEPQKDLRGTLIVLQDAGYSEDEAVRWMLEPDDALGTSPIEALRAGRKAEVRRVAQALSF